MPAPLSNVQKADIARAAARAWACCPDRAALIAANPSLSASAVAAAWRHVEQGKACGRQSLRECTQADYLSLLGHFQALAGLDRAATRSRQRQASDDSRTALHKLYEALASAKLPVGYAEAICRRQYRVELHAASSRQLWCLVFTVRNRAVLRKAAHA